MKTTSDQKDKKRLLLALFLFVCVAITTVIVLGQMKVFLPSDKGAISLIPDEEVPGSNISSTDKNEEKTDISNGSGEQNGDSEEPFKVIAGMETSDGELIWEKETEVKIFTMSYNNENDEITVQSSNGDKVIAPGTSNSYTFKLKNTGNVALDYTVEMESFVSSSGIMIPIESRISRYDGEWVLGDEESYVQMEEFHAVDRAILGANKYTYYTLEWMWPFESGNDEWDTFLGDLSVDEELVFSIVLHTMAEVSSDPNADGGIQAPITGDNNLVIMWSALAALSMFVFIFILLKKEEDSQWEAKR